MRGPTGSAAEFMSWNPRRRVRTSIRIYGCSNPPARSHGGPAPRGTAKMYWTYLSDTPAQWEIAELEALFALDAGRNP